MQLKAVAFLWILWAAEKKTPWIFLGLGLPNKSNFNILHILKDFYFYEDILLGRPLKVTNIQ
jgi:hypothetical protein